MRRAVSLVIGPLVFLACYFFFPASQIISAMIGVTLWMLFWWLSEVVALSVTAMLPIVLFPLLGILSPSQLSSFYAHPLVFLFLGGFLLALALEKTQLHLRVSLLILKRVGTKPRSLLAGFLLASAVLSMWISNTATAVMMYPIALAVSKRLGNGTEGKQDVILLLAVAYGANIGGIATLIGTPPNLILAGFVEEYLDYTLSFATWMLWGVPIAALLLFLGFWVMQFWLSKATENQLAADEYLSKELANLGKLSVDEKRFLVVFFIAVFSWVFRPYLAEFFDLKNFTDTTVALVAGLLLFLVPAKNTVAILEWRDTEQLPWGILLLFGGGLSLAGGFSETGLITILGEFSQQIPLTSQLGWVVVVAFFGIFATELMSNLALVTVLLPMILALSTFLGIPFFQLALPFTIASSCAFMLPMATPPNAIVFAGGKIKIRDMAMIGFYVNMLAFFLLIAVFGSSITQFLPNVGP